MVRRISPYIAIASLALTCGVLVARIQAEDPAKVRPLKIGVMRLTNDIFDQSDFYRRVMMDLESWTSEAFKDKLDKARAEFGEAEAAFNNAKNNPLASDEERAALAHKSEVANEKFRLIQKDRERWFADLHKKFSAELLAATLIVAEEVAREEGYDLVLRMVDLSGSRALSADPENQTRLDEWFAMSSQSSALLYCNDKSAHIVDISKEVSERLLKRDVQVLREKARKKISGQLPDAPPERDSSPPDEKKPGDKQPG